MARGREKKSLESDDSQKAIEGEVLSTQVASIA